MKTRKIFFSCLFLLLSQLSPSLAQNSPPSQSNREILTNASVVELVRMGLSDDLIITKIRQSERNFDTSVAGLRELRVARVSDAVVREMLSGQNATPSATAAASPAAATAPRGNSETASVDNDTNESQFASRDPGIYLREDELIEIFPTVFSGTRTGFLGTALTYGIMRSRMRAVVRGGSANIRTTRARPEFYFFFTNTSDPNRMSGFSSFGATSPGEFVLVKMERKQNSRETVLGEFNAYGSSTGARSRDIRDFTFHRVHPGLFRVTVREELTPGEYCFYFAGTPTGLGFAGGKIFDFSVVAAQ